MALDAAVMECYTCVERGEQSGMLTLNLLTRNLHKQQKKDSLSENMWKREIRLRGG
ncbi:MAG: hypothetical protein JW896_13000 [Deltaproteobacteria bacterium]|nr:hypothetical protein [Deltaproteobacteria bacterium]